MYIVRKRKLGVVPQIEALSREAGRIYTDTLVWFWRHVRRHHLWLSSAMMQKRLRNGQPTILHSQSPQAVIQSFFVALAGWRKARTLNPDLKPPYKRKHFFKIIWKTAAIHIRDDQLVLANAKGTPPVIIPNWTYDLPVQVEIGWDGKQYELRASYQVAAPAEETGDIASADLDEVHYATIGTEDFALILNGRLLRSKRRYRNKLQGKLQAQMAKKGRGSRR
jgi:putative transposase